MNPRTGQDEEYPLEGEVTLDSKTGYFRLSWNGMDGRRKTLIWEPPWNVDAVVEARMGYDRDNGQNHYTYTVKSLPSSRKKLETLIIELGAPAADTKAPDETWFSSQISAGLAELLGVADGREWSQARRGLVGLLPGQEATGFSYKSSALPGIVKCFVRAHTKGHSAGEEAPSVLVDAIVKYNWMLPQGYTVGPDERLAKMGAKGRLNYLVIRLPQMLELGWIENEKVMQWYKENLLAGKTAEVRTRTKSDFDKQLITSEVLALMTYLTR